MNIGLDIDGCLTDIENFHLKYGVPFFEKKFNKSIANEYGSPFVRYLIVLVRKKPDSGLSI